MTPRGFSFLAVLILVVGIGGLFAADQPPTNLQMVGDHWTAWDPPSEFPEGSEVYVIERGDTLWDLSNQFYGDPYLWPQLWERNRYVMDAHWIYPGDPLVVGVEVTPIEDVADMGDDGDDEGGLDEDESHLETALSALVPLGSEDDIYCGGYITPSKQEFDYTIIGSEFAFSGHQTSTSTLVKSIEEKSYVLNLTLGDVVYVSGGRETGLLPGGVYSIVRPEGAVEHPTKRKKMGQFNRYLGRVRILSVQEDSAIAEIAHACHSIELGDYLKPFMPEPVPLARLSGLVGVNNPVPSEALVDAPLIILADMGNVSLGQGHVVYIDRGTVDDLAPGDLYTIYRATPKGLPPLMIGELAVLSVGEEASLAKILASRYTVHVGDRLDPKLH